MKRRAIALAATIGLALSSTGCARYYYGGASGGAPEPTDVVALNYQAADALIVGAASIDPRQPVLVATLVHLDDLNQSSRLGRLFSEQLASRLTQRGLQVRELKLRGTVHMKRGTGELLLSREVREVSQQQDAQAVLVGTYAPSASTVFVSLKLVSPASGAVLSAVDYAVPLDADVRGLLGN